MAVYLNGELVLYGFVGDNYWDEGFTAVEVLDALAEHGSQNDLNVRINSGGGYVDDGRAIFNALKAHDGEVTVSVDAVAASAASLIAMAGDRIVMRTGTLMMIHDPAGVTFGTAEDHQRSIKALERVGQAFAETYAARSGNDVDDVREAMKATTWMTAEEAVETGYADESETTKSIAASAFDYRAYAHTPKRLVALSKKRGWSFKARAKAATSAASTSQKETQMADEKTADEKSADTAKVKADAAADTKARIKAITGLDEAKGREDLARHIAFDTDMDIEAARAMLASAPKIEASASSETASGDEPDPDPTAYEANRLRASGQAKPDARSQRVVASVNRGEIFASRAAAMKGA